LKQQKAEGDRLLSEHDYQAIKQAIEKIQDASDDLNAGLRDLHVAFGKCCIHAPGAGDPVMRKRAS
jgi:hypothetical protein